MPRNKKFEGDMTQIGTQRQPPFAHLPQALFEGRAARFARLAPTSPVKEYMEFLGAITTAQAQTSNRFQEADFAAALNLDGKAVSMPPVNLDRLIKAPVFEEIAQEFFTQLDAVPMPQSAKDALAVIRNNKEMRETAAHNLLRQTVPASELAQHIFMLAALQVAAALAASKVDEKTLKPQQGNLCPACGGTHFASMIVGWPNAEGTRFCSCLYCGTLWNVVRVKCTFCDATGGIEYREIEGGPGTITAECCETCGRYCKQMNGQKDMGFDVFADDIGSLALDLLLQEGGQYQRGAFNPFMSGF